MLGLNLNMVLFDSHMEWRRGGGLGGSKTSYARVQLLYCIEEELPVESR